MHATENHKVVRQPQQREVIRDIAPSVAMLPLPYREALTLTELEGLTEKQAAEMLGISLSSMKSRVQRGRQQLRAAFEDGCHVGLDGLHGFARDRPELANAVSACRA